MVKRTSMGRGMETLLALAAASGETESPWRVSPLAQSVRRERSQISRILSQAASSGLLERGVGGYRVSTGVYAFSQALTERRLRSDGLTVLERLSQQVEESCFLGQLYGDSTVTIAECIVGDTSLYASWMGRAYPAFNSDAGQATLWDATDEEVRAVLAGSRFGTGGPRAARSVDEFLERLAAARKRGYSVVDEEAEEGLVSVAAPVFDFRGESVAALQIVGERDRMIERIGSLGRVCAAAADELSSLLGGCADSARDLSEV